MTHKQYEQRLQYFLDLRLHDDHESINHKMQMELFDWHEGMITLMFPVEEWQLNPMGMMHGGMLATAIDMTMGCVSYVFSNAKHTPTITMNIQYVRPVVLHKKLFVKAISDHVGGRITLIRCWVWQEDEKTPCVTASGSYIVNQ